ncbi:YfiR family protein [Chryseolinea sp. H1M3-3]|uniref:YfiR family protein n=1 Tax=Chryseolinea sp. H1M3-3 TaxID=3034144 RepID=UPI0023EBD7C9|nr:YfiR family protein [Chryseolinea sp. H1M3-3]
MHFSKLYFLLTALVFSFTSKAQTTNYQVYALYVVNIAKYSSWPALSGEFNITVFGRSKVYDELLKQNGKMVNGHNMKITQAENISDIGHPQIIYLADGKSNTLDDLIKMTEGKSVMIICEREGLHKRGAGFSFVVMDNGTLRCDINASELEKRQIRLSKNLSALTNSSI